MHVKETSTTTQFAARFVFELGPLKIADVVTDTSTDFGLDKSVISAIVRLAAEFEDEAERKTLGGIVAMFLGRLNREKSESAWEATLPNPDIYCRLLSYSELAAYEGDLRGLVYKGSFILNCPFPSNIR
jgi:hypothetical protein